MKVAALGGGVGAGRFLRGLARLVPGDDLTVIVNVGDDVRVHGLHVSPDPDSVVYWLGDAFDRERGWGRRGDTFRATEELRAFGAPDAWFSLGDLDLATHLFRTTGLADGVPLSEVTRRIAARFGVGARILPVTDDPLTTRIACRDRATGDRLDLHFQEYWVRRGGVDPVLSIRYEHAERSRPAPGVLEALAAADAIVVCPSNPAVSIGPILAVPGVREALVARRERVVGISGIVGGAPVAGMADRLLPALGVEVSAVGVAAHYREFLAAWVIDERDRDLAPAIERMGVRVGVLDTIMRDDERAEAVARAALALLG
ncbi:MAG: 2-phospho-L-lactate transferase [Actinomycetota bacterium]|jgi:LPPG:FO 2-phospho-L-lactate transferase|nr:MAG: 2-phospho-L-lactate transferase [Actinomycetota bacterium]